MSLYGKSNSNQDSAIGNLVPASGLPMWMLALAAYFIAVTLTNKIPGLIFRLEAHGIDSEYIGYFIGDITGSLSAILLLLFILTRNAACLYYLVLAASYHLALVLVTYSMDIKVLSSYYSSVQGLSSIPSRIIGWAIGWNNVSDSVKVQLRFVGAISTFVFCALLLYFHKKRKTKGELF
jgi:hypothetical protein